MAINDNVLAKLGCDEECDSDCCDACNQYLEELVEQIRNKLFRDIGDFDVNKQQPDIDYLRELLKFCGG